MSPSMRRLSTRHGSRCGRSQGRGAREHACGDLRREPDGRWFFGSTYLGRDGERRALMVDGVGDRVGVVAARLAEALGTVCDAADGFGYPAAVQVGCDALRRFERWKEGRAW